MSTMDTTTAQGAPTVTMTGPDAPFRHRRFHVDGREVVTIAEYATRSGGAEWHVYLTRALGTGRYYRTLDAALAEGHRLAEGYTRCSLPVRARLCRLQKRHDGSCVPWD